MAYSKYGKTRRFQRNESVEIHVREVTLLPNTDDERSYIEIREYIASSELYGHGVVLPLTLAGAVAGAIDGIVSDTEGQADA